MNVVRFRFRLTELTRTLASIAHEEGRLFQLNSVFINRDIDSNGNEGLLATTLRNTLLSSLEQKHHLGWNEDDAWKLPNDEAIEKALVDDEWAWVVVVAEENATQRLISARENGDTSYNPSSAISIHYSQARNEQAASMYTQIAQQLVEQAALQAGRQLTQSYLSSQSGNSTAIDLLSQAPSTISNPFNPPRIVNVREYNHTVANAITLVGLVR